MDILDNIDAIKKLDKGLTLSSIKFLPDQCEAAWREVKKISIPYGYRNVTSILFCGMGGSAYGARTIKSMYSDQIKIPVDLVNSYDLPKYVDRNVLIFAASYSGNTEETISCVMQALARKTRIIGIGAGGHLAKLLKQFVRPMYTFSSTFNPSNQPRLAQGYMQIGQIAIMHAVGFLNERDDIVSEMVINLRSNNKKFSPDEANQENIAKQIARLVENKIVNIIGGEFLEGAIHSIRNPFNETGKHFANYFILPELNHHLLEGLSYPKINKQSLLFLLINSPFYSDQIKKRMALTKDVIEKNSIPTFDVNLTFTSKLGQVFELIQLGSFTTFYLSLLHGTDPSVVPWVDYFKQKLGGPNRN